MFCKNCGNKIKEGSKFCSSCGLEIEVIPETKKEKFEVAVDKKTDTPKIIIDQVVTFVSVIIGFIIGKYLGLVLFIFIFAFLIGQWFPKWYMKRGKINITLVKLIVWSNVLTWLLPPLGIMTGFAALEFGNHFPEDSKKYKTIAIIGIVVSLFNVLAGILMNI
ncbi:MAG: zinc-ribbon domain-containing protein [Candidatus Paceibacterota bacterium]|jgi:hypothetical protein